MATSANVSLRLFILGATGRTGLALVTQAVERGHQITAFLGEVERGQHMHQIVGMAKRT